MSIEALPAGVEAKMGANLTRDGATFRVWAPHANAVFVLWGGHDRNERPSDSWRLHRMGSHFVGFVRGAKDGDKYRFWVEGPYGRGPRRDPWARELEWFGYPHCDGILRDPHSYPWASAGFVPPAFHELSLYQVHVGTYFATDVAGNDERLTRSGRFLDVVERIEYIADLGVRAVQLLPIVEWETQRSLGYNSTDIFSPEMDYFTPLDELDRYKPTIDRLFAKFGKLAPSKHVLHSGINQLKLLVDLLHLHGVAVLFDVVYNHINGDQQEQALRRYDYWEQAGRPHGIYFGSSGWAGGMVPHFPTDEVRSFLIENAVHFLNEYHVDGFRYDEVTVIDRMGGWRFCQDLTDTLHFINPKAVHISEYWEFDKSWAIKPTHSNGAGFDATWLDTARDGIRRAVAGAAVGRDAHVDMNELLRSLAPPFGSSGHWRAVQLIENHDLHRAGHDKYVPRIARLADSSMPRSWYARSRARVANGLLLTAPGIPQVFMGQEILDDNAWTDNPSHHAHARVWWDGLRQSPEMRDHHRFMRDLFWARRHIRGLTGDGLNAYQAHDIDRVLAFHRWVEGVGEDVVVVASLNEQTLTDYTVGFPSAGWWRELLNSDAYESSPGHVTRGNAGAVGAHASPAWGMPASAKIVIPANSILVFGRG